MRLHEVRESRANSPEIGTDPASALAPPPPLAAEPGVVPAPTRPARRWRRWLLAALAVVVVAGALLATLGPGITGGAPTPVPTPTAIRYDARGRIAPVQQAHVATLQGGTVRGLAHVPGEAVQARDELARIDTGMGTTEVLVAPFAGTVLAVLVQVGDSLLPGAQVAVVGDLSALRVETTDVDEYLVGSLRLGQVVDIAVDALPGRTLAGRISGITLSPQPTGAGDLHYPVYVDLDRGDPALRPGMTARLRVRGSTAETPPR